MNKCFHLLMIKPSHYDDDGYVIQWLRSSIPANSLATVYGIARDCVERRVLGDGVDLVLSAYDETNTRIRVDKIAAAIRRSGGAALVALVGVQTNQFPRALDLARQFLAQGAAFSVVIGGFHVSGCLAMLKRIPADIQQAMDEGITLFAGELEGRLDALLRDAYRGELRPLYNHMNELPALQDAPVPYLPVELIKRTSGTRTSFDAGRGCPFLCSFCTIINVQGRKSRHRSAADVERIVRANAAQGVNNYFISDDNLARNQDWEAIFERLIALREGENLPISLVIQVDTMCHKIPGFIEKAARAGVNRVFIGMENINPQALKAARKGQNRITEYRALLQAWHAVGALTYAGYILGFPDDTPETIERDIKIIQRELPVDILEFFILTPLPGSQDHRALYEQGAWLEPDMNNYDTAHVTAEHPRMTRRQWQAIYQRAWRLYYSPEHVETVIRRAAAWGFEPRHMMTKLLHFYFPVEVEKVHPLEGGVLRRKYRRDRRPGLALEHPLAFYPRYFWETASKLFHFYRLRLRFQRIRRRAERRSDAARRGATGTGINTGINTDIAMQPVRDEELRSLELFTATAAAKAAAAKAQRLQARSA